MTEVTPSASCSHSTSSVLKRGSAPSASARERSTGSRPIWVTKRRSDGLMSRTPSLSLGMCQASSLPGQRLDRHDRAVGLELRVRALAHLILDPRVAQDLHRPLQDERSAWMDGAAGVTLDTSERDPMPAEQHRRGHADETAADDQDRGLVVMHENDLRCWRVERSWSGPSIRRRRPFRRPHLRRCGRAGPENRPVFRAARRRGRLRDDRVRRRRPVVARRLRQARRRGLHGVPRRRRRRSRGRGRTRTSSPTSARRDRSTRPHGSS